MDVDLAVCDAPELYVAGGRVHLDGPRGLFDANIARGGVHSRRRNRFDVDVSGGDVHLEGAVAAPRAQVRRRQVRLQIGSLWGGDTHAILHVAEETAALVGVDDDLVALAARPR